jgi:PAS domain S-box-containing protein
MGQGWGDGVVPVKHLDAAIRRQLLIYAVLPLAYVITGRVGLLLAVPPGYATAVFMPAGIAVGAMFMAGPSSLPGILIGSFLLNVWIGFSIAGQFGVLSAATAVAIALASTVQAALGGTVLRRVIGYPAAFDNPRDLVRLLVLAPLFCVTSASLSLATMWAIGAIRSGNLPSNWITWWAGDTLGVLVALPLLFVLAAEPRSLWRSRIWTVAVPMLLCFGLFVAIFIRVNSWESDQSLFEFRLRSEQFAGTLRATLEEQRGFLEQLSDAFVSRHQPVTRHEFRDLVQTLLHRFPIVQAVEWVPLVQSSERAGFEAAQRAEVPGFEVRQRGPAGEMRAAAVRNRFYPVTYIEPFVGNEQAIGFDLASDESRRVAVEAATTSGNLAATAPVHLVQEPGSQSGILVIDSVSNGPSGPGVVVVVLRMGTFATSLVEPLRSILALRFADAAAAAPFYDAIPRTVSVLFKTEFNFGGRRYVVSTAPSPAYLATHQGWQSWAVLAAGALGTGLMGGLLLLGTGHGYRFGQLAKKLRENEASLREKEAELESIIYRTPFMLIRLDRDLRYRFISHAYLEMSGRRPEQVIGKRLPDVLGDKNFHSIRPYIEKVLQGDRVEFEREVHYQGVGTRFLHVIYTPEKDDSGKVTGWIASMLDITERKQAEEEQKRAADAEQILIRELQHRTNNLLAVIQGIAQKTLSGSGPLDEARKIFQGRLLALAGTYRQLTKSNWSGVSLREIVDLTLEPFATRIEIDGPDLMLSAKNAQNFSLALHELATNALKHGALSSAGGNVRIAWTIVGNGDGSILKFRWQERGGPAVLGPGPRGFGTLLLESTFKMVNLDYAPEGLTCHIEVPLGAIEFMASPHLLT